MTPEGKVKKEVDAILRRHKVWYFKPVQMGYGTHGIPDYICCVGGWFLGVECKGLDWKKPTNLQAACLDAIRMARGSTFVVTPSTIDQFENLVCFLSLKNKR